MLAEGLVALGQPILRWISAVALALVSAAAGLVLFWLILFASIPFLLYATGRLRSRSCVAVGLRLTPRTPTGEVVVGACNASVLAGHSKV